MPRSTACARVFVGGPAYHTVVERLGHAHRGVALHQVDGRLSTESLVVVTDGTDLDHIGPAMARVKAETTRILVVGADAGLVGPAFPGARVTPVAESDQPAMFWRLLNAALADQPVSVTGSTRLFISHATDDEAGLQPAVDALRRLGVSVFSCGDSIPGGARWWDHILGSLKDCDRFVSVLSPAARASTWCAFEAGAAVALGKPIQLVSLDGLPPPSFLAHLQMQDVARMQILRPWLNRQDAVLEALLAPIPGPTDTETSPVEAP